MDLGEWGTCVILFFVRSFSCRVLIDFFSNFTMTLFSPLFKDVSIQGFTLCTQITFFTLIRFKLSDSVFYANWTSLTLPLSFYILDFRFLFTCSSDPVVTPSVLLRSSVLWNSSFPFPSYQMSLRHLFDRVLPVDVRDWLNNLKNKCEKTLL